MGSRFPGLEIPIRIHGYFKFRDHLYYCLSKRVDDAQRVLIESENCQTGFTVELEYDERMEVIHARNRAHAGTAGKR